MATIAIIDYGMGNLRSVAKALEHVSPKSRIQITQSAHAIEQADRVVFPGQGAIRDCMHELATHGLIDAVKQAAAEKPFLGLCLGPQALLDFSEENKGVQALGVLAGKSVWFGHQLTGKLGYKIPHMGWNQVHQLQPHPLWEGIPQDSRFYFVHSYYLVPDDPALIAAKTNYLFDFASVLARDNLFAVQFHPEKSARWGLQLLANFSQWNPV
ncbi:MAG: imidazole glycerol phosphate synthase subunit HisH [Candidatus Competibacteraceae bacterium]|nr:imidazole glycerol phosphate synthase subunit HisH [Candidatus Competibacteraceae bacterium]MCB1812407.1 imidazole glycerol phosphate synthase subunit HisH [Candidatus Competibacteraceae bacterium]